MEKENILLEHGFSMLFYKHESSPRDAAYKTAAAIKEGLWFTFPEMYSPSDRRKWLETFLQILNMELNNSGG